MKLLTNIALKIWCSGLLIVFLVMGCTEGDNSSPNVTPAPQTNVAPVAQNDTATIVANSPVTLTVLTNDSDADGDALTVTAVTQGANGRVVNNGNGTVTYTPNSNFSGNDIFTYTIDDGHQHPVTAMVMVTITMPRTLRAQNFSQPTMCAEEDNVSVPLFAPAGLRTLEITATHPQYDFFNDNCAPNFANCAIDSANDFTFSPGTRVLFDDGRTVVQGVRVERWFLPNTMVASVAGGPAFDSHFVRFIRRIGTTSLFPEVMVINMDGNIRLKPQAPVGKPNNDTCFGSSVLIGPANPSTARPVAEIASLSYSPAADRFNITYRDSSTATLAVQAVDRSQMTIRVDIGYPVSGQMPAAIFRSMFVADGNADVDRIQSDSGTVGILNFTEDIGRSFTFFRAVRSVHNTSAPDIEIGVSQEE